MPTRAARSLRLAAAAAVAVWTLLLAGRGAGAAPEWSDRAAVVPVRYRIDATLNPGGANVPPQITGQANIVWTNLSRDRVEYVYFHLYANAFRDRRSVFLRERERDGRPLPDPFVPGSCRIDRLTVVGPSGRQPTTEFVALDDAPGDETVLRAKLPQPVEPHTGVVLNVDFTTVLPRPIARMGAVRDFVMAAQWYPKLGVYLGQDSPKEGVRDGWFCPHYHTTTEFAADFADYDVGIRVPAGWTVGATGTPAVITAGTDSPEPTPGTVRSRWTAESVVDFAWTASPRFLTLRRTIDPDGPARDARESRVLDHVRNVRGLLGLTDEEADLPAVDVVLLLQPEHEEQAERHFEAARVALALFGTWLGPYPYERLTIVDPPHDVPVGGMEYPTLVTAGTNVGSPPEALRLEHVTVHEIGHQWFMNLLASNEALEAWLDEGLNSWFTGRAMEAAWEKPPTPLTTLLGFHFRTELPLQYPGVAAQFSEAAGLPSWLRPPQLDGFRLWRDGPSLLSTWGSRSRPASPDDPPDWVRQGQVLSARRHYLRSAGSDPVVQPGWDFLSRESYGGNVYSRAVLVLESLDREIRRRFDDAASPREGERRSVAAFREYARRFRFRHPTTADLLEVLTEETGWTELRQRFAQLATTTGLLDYAVDRVRVREPEDDPAPAPGEPEPGPVTEFVVFRRGEIVVPVTVRVDVQGAERPTILHWDGVGRYRSFRVPGRARTVFVDPEQIYPMDACLSDNVWSDRTNLRPGLKWGAHALLWLENAITSYGRFF